MSHLSSNNTITTVEVLGIHVHGTTFTFGTASLTTCECKKKETTSTAEEQLPICNEKDVCQKSHDMLMLTPLN